MNKTELFREIYKEYVKGEEWLDIVPNDISSAFFDNPYVNSSFKTVDLLMKYIFNKDEYAAVNWFLYEWQNNKDLCAIYDDKEFCFANIDEYIKYLKEYEGWE